MRILDPSYWYLKIILNFVPRIHSCCTYKTKVNLEVTSNSYGLYRNTDSFCNNILGLTRYICFHLHWGQAISGIIVSNLSRQFTYVLIILAKSWLKSLYRINYFILANVFCGVGDAFITVEMYTFIGCLYPNKCGPGFAMFKFFRVSGIKIWKSKSETIEFFRKAMGSVVKVCQ